MSNVLSIIEHQGGALRPASLNALTLAREAAAAVGGQVTLLVIGSGVGAVAEQAKAYGDVLVCDQENLAHYMAPCWAEVVRVAAEQISARLVVAPATTLGKDLLPRVSGVLEAGLASDVTDFVSLTADTASFKREMWAGNVLGTVEISGPQALVSVRGTEFAQAAPLDAPGTVTAISAHDTCSVRSKFVSFAAAESDRPDLTEANVVVAIGRGVKGPEGVQLLEGLADHFGAAVGATRAVVDAGWLPNDLQVGQTGKVVAPELYFAVGISGAIQHWAGMKGSKVIVAINKDEEAPIMALADYALQADLFKAVPELLEQLKAL